MSNTFAVDTARINAASGDIERLSASIESEIRAMMSRLTGLQDCWQGVASANFQNVIRDWSVTQERVRESLQQISVTLRTAGQDYEMVEQANRARFIPA